MTAVFGEKAQEAEPHCNISLKFMVIDQSQILQWVFHDGNGSCTSGLLDPGTWINTRSYRLESL